MLSASTAFPLLLSLSTSRAFERTACLNLLMPMKRSSSHSSIDGSGTNFEEVPRVIRRTSPSRLRWMLVMTLAAIARRFGFRYGLLYRPQFVPFKARSYHRNLTKK